MLSEGELAYVVSVLPLSTDACVGWEVVVFCVSWTSFQLTFELGLVVYSCFFLPLFTFIGTELLQKK